MPNHVVTKTNHTNTPIPSTENHIKGKSKTMQNFPIHCVVAPQTEIPAKSLVMEERSDKQEKCRNDRVEGVCGRRRRKLKRLGNVSVKYQ